MNSRRYSKFRASIIASLILLSLLVSPAMAVSGDTIRISVDTSNVQVYDNLTPQLCNVWNLESDFQVFPNQENPNRDSCGNLNIWYFLSSTTLTRNPPYTLLPNFYNDANGVAGLEAWMGTATQEGYHSYTPDIWVNN